MLHAVRAKLLRDSITSTGQGGRTAARPQYNITMKTLNFISILAVLATGAGHILTSGGEAGAMLAGLALTTTAGVLFITAGELGILPKRVNDFYNAAFSEETEQTNNK